jgi:carbonic anhydrase
MAREIVEPGFPSRLTSGFAAFRDGLMRPQRERMAQLARAGQNPDIMVIACCDSRAAPEMIFDAAPGEIFVVRNVANLVPPYSPDGEYHGTSAALEFAVQALKVKHIVVMGHGRCGGVHAFLSQEGSEPLSPGDFIGKWITIIQPATRDLRCEEVAAPDRRQRAMEEASIRNSIANLMTFPCVRILAERNKLRLHGAWFDIFSGELWIMDPGSGNFFPAAVPASLLEG